MSYSDDRQWSDQYIPAVKRLVGPLLLEESSFEIDTQQASDLIVLTARDMRIAARVRRYGFADRYPWEFTIRSRRENGIKTELAKITDGWGDWMFYGHAGQSAGEIIRWFVISLHSLRAHLIRDGFRPSRELRFGEKPNGDGTHFMWFDLRSFGSDILISSSHSLPEEATA